LNLNSSTKQEVAKTTKMLSQQPFKLLFSGEQDLVDTWGKLHISVTPVEWINQNIPLSEMTTNRTPVACFPLADGSWEVYSQEFSKVSEGAPGKWYEGMNRWKLLRAITKDGTTFSKVETVIPDSIGTWTYHLTMAYNPDADEYLMLRMKNTSCGFAYHAFFSTDGKNWKKYTGTREGGALFYEGDAMSVFWSPVLKRFVLVSKSLQPWKKHIIDHGGTTTSLNDTTFKDRRKICRMCMICINRKPPIRQHG
jgi:hypothetical protein